MLERLHIQRGIEAQPKPKQAPEADLRPAHPLQLILFHYQDEPKSATVATWHDLVKSIRLWWLRLRKWWRRRPMSGNSGQRKQSYSPRYSRPAWNKPLPFGRRAGHGCSTSGSLSRPVEPNRSLPRHGAVGGALWLSVAEEKEFISRWQAKATLASWSCFRPCERIWRQSWGAR